MFKKFCVSILVICVLFSTIAVYAVDEQIGNNQIGIVQDTDIEEKKSELKLEYNPKEQKVLEKIPEIGCKAGFIAEPETGKVLFEKNAHERMYPASTCKILTALVVLENCQLTDTAIVSQNAISLVPLGYSTANLKAGEELSIYTLLQALLIPSANEAANVLAEHVGGSIEGFAQMCNDRAKELGCEDLHFVNPNGIHNDNHYCTAYDLYLIAKECQKFDVFKEIVKTRSFTVPASNMHTSADRTFTNTNSLILPSSTNYYYQYCTGIKTGTTTPAGQCLVASSTKDDINLISVVLGGGTNSKNLVERFYDTTQLFDFVYDNYSIKSLAEENQVLKNIDVLKATKETANLDIVIDTDIAIIVPNDITKENVEKIVDISEEIEAPIKQNQVLGTVTFKADGLNYTADLVASHDVEKQPYWLYNTIVVAVVLLVFIIISVVIKSSRKKKRSRRK